MRFPRKRGSTSNMVRIFIPDNTVSTGAGCTGLTSASANLTIVYYRTLDGTATTYTGANIEAQTTIGTFQAPSTSSKIRFKAVDATGAPGLYELQFHDSATAFGAGDTSDGIIINIYEATTTALKIGPNMCLIPLVPWDYQDGVRMGLTALPNAAAAAANGLLTYGASTGQLNPASGKIPATLAATDVTGNVACDIQTIKTQTVTCSAGVTVPASIGTSTYSGTDTAGTTTLLTRIPGALTLNAGMVEVDLQTIKGQAVTAAAGVTFPTSIQATTTFPANFASLAIDTNGRVKIQGGLTKASSITMMFYMALSSDHVSPATGKSVTATVSLDGGAFGSTTNSPAEVANGWYKIVLAAGDTNGSTMALSFAASSCDTTQATFIMQP